MLLKKDLMTMALLLMIIREPKGWQNRLVPTKDKQLLNIEALASESALMKNIFIEIRGDNMKIRRKSINEGMERNNRRFVGKRAGKREGLLNPLDNVGFPKVDLKLGEENKRMRRVARPRRDRVEEAREGREVRTPNMARRRRIGGRD